MICDSYLRKPVSRSQLIKDIMRFLSHTVREVQPQKISGVVEEHKHEDLAGLPEELLKALKHAAIQLNSQTVRQIIDRIRQIDAPVGDALPELIRNYQYDRLINLLPT